ncbi:MAG: hypothetical protein ACM3WU_08660 [Bacillota bacterium]
MQVDGVYVSLSAREIASLVKSLPLPRGVQVSDVVLTDNGLEATVRASLLLGLPVKFKVEIDHFSGAKVFFRVSPPVKPNWLVVRPLMMAIPGARYMGNSMVEIDLISASRGYLSGINLKRLSLNRNGFVGEASAVTSTVSWGDLLSGITW